ncbi:MAG: IS110 family transposase [Planctomycetes bacterium]|nr:IS110 family transposase [Planctomycetota bacterium]
MRAKNSERRARQQLLMFLLRQGFHYSGKTNWTEAHFAWIHKLEFPLEAHRLTLTDYLHTVEQATARVARTNQYIHEVIQSWSGLKLVQAFQSLHGIGELTAVALAAEVVDFRRFAKASQFMAYVGLVPSERSNGESIRRSGITKTGNKHLRRLLVEPSWNYRFPPRKSAALKRRCRNVDPEIVEIAWKAHLRLNKQYRKFVNRPMSPKKAIIAIARELAGFIWSIGSTLQNNAA